MANHSFQGVFGSEYNFSDGPTLGLQGIIDYLAADQGSDAMWAFSMALNLMYEVDNRTKLETLWLQNFSDGSGVISPSLTYTFADGVTGEVSASIFYGDEATAYGSFIDNSEIKFGLAYAF